MKDSDRVKNQPLDRARGPGPCGAPDFVPVHSVEESKQRNLFARGVELLCSLVSDGAAQAVATQKVRPMGLNAVGSLSRMRGHLFDCFKSGELPSRPWDCKP